MPTGISVSSNIINNAHPNESAFINDRALPPNVANLYETTGNLKGTFGSFSSLSRSIISTCGNKSSSYYDLFYERIWIIPETLDFNGIAVASNVPVTIWNSYSSTKTLTTVSSSLTGISHDLTLSKVFTAFESKQVNFQYSDSAPISLEGVITFTFSDAEDPMLMVTGSRAEVFLYNHNWETAITERYSYLTNIIESDDGSEQGILLRNYPSRTMDYEFLSANTQSIAEIARQRAKLENFLSHAQDSTIALPIFSDKLLLESQLAIGSSSIVFSKNPQLYDYYVNGNLIIYDSYDNYEIIKISSINSTTIGLTSNTTKLWNVGAKIAPIRQALLSEETISGIEHTQFLENYSISFTIKSEDTVNNPRFAAYSPTYTYKSYPVYFPDHNYIDDKSIELYKHLGKMGTDYGIFRNESRLNTNRKKIGIKLIKNTRQDLCNFFGFFAALKGRLNYLWIAEKNKSFQLAENYNAGQNNITIYDIGYYKYIKQNNAKRYLVFYRSNGSIYFNKIIDSMNNGNGTETLYLESTFNFNFTPADFPDISYLTLCRSDSDSLEISYSTQDSVDIAHSFIQLLNISL